MMRFLPVCFLFLSVAISNLPAADTGAYRGPDNSGVYPEKGLLKEWPPEGPKLLWKQPLNQGYAGVAVVSGMVYVAHGHDNALDVFTLDGKSALRVKTGNASWKRFSGTRSTPVVEGGVAVTTTPDGNIYGVDLKAGNVRWKLNAWTSFGSKPAALGWGVPESPMHHDGAVIFNACSRADDVPPLVAVDVQSGLQVWGADAGRNNKRYSATDLSGTCFRHNGRALLVYPTFRYLLCADPTTGRRLWEIPETGSKNLTPSYGDGLLLWGPPGKSQMLRISPDGATYDVLWTRHNTVPWYTQTVICDGRVYLFGNPYMQARAPEKQAASLLEEGIGYESATPDEALAPESVRTNGPRAVAEWQRQARNEKHLLCLDAETGRLLQSRPAADPGHIIAADGMVYVLELVSEGEGKPTLPRVSLIKPTAAGFETTGTLVPQLGAEDLRWESHRRAANAQTRQWASEDFLYQRHVNPAIAEGRLFFRYGPLLVYDIRAKDWTPQPTAPVPNVRNPDLTSSNVTAIAESASAEVRPFIAALASRYENERTNAVKSLAALPLEMQKTLMPLLVKLLDVKGDRAWLVQQSAMTVLETNGAAAASVVPALQERTLAALDSNNGHLAERLLLTLQQISPAAMTQAVVSAGSRLSSEDPAVRRQTVAAFKVVGPAVSAVAAPLAACLSSPDRRMVNESAAMLRSIIADARPAVPVLQSGLTNAVVKKESARTELIADVLQSIDSNGVAACAGKLAALVGDTDPRVAGLAMRTLNNSGATSVESVPVLVRGLKSDDRLVAEQSALMLRRLGPQGRAAVDPLVQYVSGETGTLRVVAAELLGCIGPAARSGVQILAAGVLTNDLVFARASAVALGRIGADAASAISCLVTAMSGRDVELARAATAAIGAIGGAVRESSEEPLIVALRHYDEAVRSNAVAALRAVGRDPVPFLVTILKGPDKRQAAWAASALGRIGPDARAAIPDLISSLKEKDGYLVSAAVEALGGIGRDAAVAVPDLMALSRGSDKRLGETIQRTIDRVKIDNHPPTAFDVSAVCQEGKTVILALRVGDPDDVVDTLVASPMFGPVYGTLTRLSNTQFLYRAAYGGMREDLFLWKTADRSTPSDVAKAVIRVTPDRTPPAVTQAFMWTNAPSVRIEFDEPLLTNTAMDVRNYKIEPDVPVNRVQMDTNGMAVMLHTGPLVEGGSYTVGLRKLRDRSKAANPLTAKIQMTCLAAGLAYEYCEAASTGLQWEVFSGLPAKTNGVTARIDPALRQRDESFALRFQGLIRTPIAGYYTFWLNADDRARLHVGTNVVESVAAREQAATVNLSSGMHPLRATLIQTTGTNILDISWSGPGFSRQPIPASALFHLP